MDADLFFATTSRVCSFQKPQAVRELRRLAGFNEPTPGSMRGCGRSCSRRSESLSVAGAQKTFFSIQYPAAPRNLYVVIYFVGCRFCDAWFYFKPPPRRGHLLFSSFLERGQFFCPSVAGAFGGEIFWRFFVPGSNEKKNVRRPTWRRAYLSTFFVGRRVGEPKNFFCRRCGQRGRAAIFCPGFP